MRIIVFLIFTICSTAFTFMLGSCTLKNYTKGIDYSFKSKTGDPDYANLNYWAAHPWKKDPSDNVPRALQNSENDSLADVFFIYPTTYLDPLLPTGWNANIDDKKINQRTDNTTILYQASVFNQHCRVFSPRYRQANLKAFYSNDGPLIERAFNLAYSDILAAFRYYMLNFNNGRPVIIASHSQGTKHAARLLQELFENKPLQKQLVCAYLIGLPVFENYFSTIKPCTDSTSTQCFISWRSFKKGAHPDFVKEEKLHAIVTNPLTWNINDKFADKKLNKGGILKNFNKIIPEMVSAQVQKNILWVTKPRFFGNIFLTAKNYHIVDYNLFYMNIRENAGTRINEFIRLKKNQRSK